ncbi:MAG: flagellar export chaperone FliS [Comamonadaceae bacterium CG2_30_59_20]|nr:MAG: flagellar export chaperone FliS [Comamonadaceae bacterium CG2_30_59_20]
MARSGANVYARVGLESGVMSASPHQLVSMLFNGVKAAITMARHHMAHNEIAAKGKAISKAINIIDNGLKISFEADASNPVGEALVANLMALFDYTVKCLLRANLRNDPALLDEAERLLESIGSAWREIDPNNMPQAQASGNDAAPVRFSAGA